jgi:hypothetical protein
MHWGDTQSFFQVVLALNVAYYSFRGVWQPDNEQLASLVKEIERNSKAVRARLQHRLKEAALTDEDRQRGAAWLNSNDVNGLGESVEISMERVSLSYLEGWSGA